MSMSTKLWILVVTAAAMLTGCGTPSLHPLHSEDKELFDSAIVGTWKDGDDAPTYTVTRVGDRYRLLVKNNKTKEPREWEMDVRLVQLGAGRFADFCAVENERRDHEERWGPLFVPTYMFAKYTVEGETLTLWMLNKGWLEKAIADKRVGLPTSRLSQNEVLITAETAQLQAFAQKHADDPAAFSDKTQLRRVK
jgi:hypothetical protein